MGLKALQSIFVNRMATLFTYFYCFSFDSIVSFLRLLLSEFLEETTPFLFVTHTLPFDGFFFNFVPTFP